MKNPTRRFRNEGHLSCEAELIHRRLYPPIYLSRIFREDLLDFWSANICGREDDREVLVPVGRNQFPDDARADLGNGLVYCGQLCDCR